MGSVPMNNNMFQPYYYYNYSNPMMNNQMGINMNNMNTNIENTNNFPPKKY